MSYPYEPDALGSEGSPSARPQDQQWWASRSTGSPLEPGRDEGDPRLEEPGFDPAPWDQRPVGPEPLPPPQFGLPPTDTTYESWAPSATGWAPSGNLLRGASSGGFGSATLGSARSFVERGFVELPRPLTDPDTGRSAAYLLALSVAVGILAALFVLLAAAIAFASLLGG